MPSKKQAGNSQKDRKPPIARKRRVPAKPFAKGNPWRYPKGVSGNPSGRSSLLSEAYRKWLKAPSEEDPSYSNADIVAMAQGAMAQLGDTPAAKELRQATEGDRISIDMSRLTDDQLQRIANGEDPHTVLADPSSGFAGAAEAQAGAGVDPGPDTASAEPGTPGPEALH